MRFEEYAAEALRETDNSYVGRELDLRFDIVEFLKKQLDDHKMTQSKLAEKLKMKPSQLSRIFKAESNMTLETIARIYHTFDCRPSITERYAHAETISDDLVYRQVATYETRNQYRMAEASIN